MYIQAQRRHVIGDRLVVVLVLTLTPTLPGMFVHELTFLSLHSQELQLQYLRGGAATRLARVDVQEHDHAVAHLGAPHGTFPRIHRGTSPHSHRGEFALLPS